MKLDWGDVAIGATVLVAAALVLYALVWLSPASERSSYTLFAEFDDVADLPPQAPVYLRGYTIGRVTQIRPRRIEGGQLMFRVRLTLEPELGPGERLYLPHGTVARLTYPKLLGSGVILLELPDTLGMGTLAPGSELPATRDVPLSDNVEKLSGQMVFDLGETLQGMRVLVDTMTLAAAETRRLVVRTNAQLPGLVDQLAGVLTQVDSATGMLRRTGDRLGPHAEATLDSVQLLVATSNRLLQHADRSVGQLQPRLSSILANLDSTTWLTKHFMTEVSARPARLLTGVRPLGSPRRPVAGSVKDSPPDTPLRDVRDSAGAVTGTAH